MSLTPLGIPRSSPADTVTPKEHLALELERVAGELAQLLVRVDLTVDLRATAEREQLATLLAEAQALGRTLAPHLRRGTS
jgi:hypothetical protein